MASQKLFNGNLSIDDAGKLTVTSAAIGSLDGVLKASSGLMEAAVADTDYQQAVTWGDGLSYSTGNAGIDYTGNLKITSNQLDTIQDIQTGSSPTFDQVTISSSPSSGTDVATKDYVDASAQAMKRKDNCLIATTGNISLTGEQTIDGVLTSGSRVLVWNQTDATENGIYVSDASTWARSDDCNTGAEILGALTKVLQGNTYAGYGFNNSNSSAPTIGVTDITFVNIGELAVHNSLLGLNDGDYQHLTAAQKTIATQAATTSQNGYLTSTDWNTFNNKSGGVTGGDGITVSGDEVSVDYNTTNLKITAEEIDTVQSIATNASPTFNALNLSSTVGYVKQGDLFGKWKRTSVADTATLTIGNVGAGMMLLSIGSDEEYALFSFNTGSDSVTIWLSSGNVVSGVPADGKLGVRSSASQLEIISELGSTKNVTYAMFQG